MWERCSGHFQGTFWYHWYTDAGIGFIHFGIIYIGIDIIGYLPHHAGSHPSRCECGNVVVVKVQRVRVNQSRFLGAGLSLGASQPEHNWTSH